jgi:hypothetical protein
LAIFLIVSLSGAGFCLAGDIPETLLGNDTALLFFGKVIAVTDTTVTILPVKTVKGDVAPDTAVTYGRGRMMGGGNEQVVKTYLVGYIDENNLYYWETNGTEPRTLKIKDASAMSRRLQEYLNNGDFEKAEQARKQKLASTAAASATPAPSPTEEPRAPSPEYTAPSLPASTGAQESQESISRPVIMTIIAALLILSVTLVPAVRGRKRGR